LIYTNLNYWRTGKIPVKEDRSKKLPLVHKSNVWLHVIDVEYVGEYQLKPSFSNGVEGNVDLEQELDGEIFEPLKDTGLFQQVFLTSRTIE
jgi:hypothetical protein